MVTIPDPVIAASLGAIFAALLGLAGYSLRTVRKAGTVVKANASLEATVEAQAACITALEAQVETLQRELKTAQDEIADLRRIIRDWQRVESIQQGRTAGATA